MRNTHQMAQFVEQDKTLPPEPEPGPPSPPVPPELEVFRRTFSRRTLPIDVEREARLWRMAVLELAEAVYTLAHEQPTTRKAK
jgi:hypothetical protein